MFVKHLQEYLDQFTDGKKGNEVSNAKIYMKVGGQLEEIKSEMLQNFYKDSKKVDNKKMKAFFKYNLKFPSYIEGLDYIFNNNICFLFIYFYFIYLA